MKWIDKMRKWWKMNVGLGKTMLEHGAMMRECTECGKETPVYDERGSTTHCLWCDNPIIPQKERNQKKRERLTDEDGEMTCERCGGKPSFPFPEPLPAIGQIYGITSDATPVRWLCNDCYEELAPSQNDERSLIQDNTEDQSDRMVIPTEESRR